MKNNKIFSFINDRVSAISTGILCGLMWCVAIWFVVSMLSNNYTGIISGLIVGVVCGTICGIVPFREDEAEY